MENALHYYAGNHTAKGFYSLYASNYLGLKDVILLKGVSKLLKTNMLKQLIAKCTEDGYTLEIIHCYDENYVEGVIIPELNIGVYGGPLDVFKGEKANLTTINTDSVIPDKRLTHRQNSIQRYQKKGKKLVASAHQFFEKGLRTHDRLEDIYIDHMDFGKADEEADKLTAHLFTDTSTKDKDPTYKHRFFGASGPKGVVDYIPNLTKDLDKRYFIKGRAGTGKSTFLKRIISAAEQFGLEMEIYHCGFDPDSLDMVVIRELSVCIFDSTNPHEYFPERDGDHIIDLYDIAVMPGTDEKYEKDITFFNRRYKSQMKKGMEYLKEVQQVNKKLEQIYTTGANMELFNTLVTQLYEQVNEKARTLHK